MAQLAQTSNHASLFPSPRRWPARLATECGDLCMTLSKCAALARSCRCRDAASWQQLQRRAGAAWLLASTCVCACRDDAVQRPLLGERAAAPPLKGSTALVGSATVSWPTTVVCASTGRLSRRPRGVRSSLRTPHVASPTARSAAVNTDIRPRVPPSGEGTARHRSIPCSRPRSACSSPEADDTGPVKGPPEAASGQFITRNGPPLPGPFPAGTLVQDHCLQLSCVVVVVVRCRVDGPRDEEQPHDGERDCNCDQSPG